MKKFLIIISVIFLSVFAFFFSNIKGYYHFKSYCSSEGGLRVYEPLEKSVGWLAKDKYDARNAARIKYVEFVRYMDKDGKNYDLRYIGGNPTKDDSYKIVQSDDSKIVKYRWKSYSSFLEENNRLNKFSYEIFDLSNEHILAGYYTFYYSAYGGALGGPDWQSCKNKMADPHGWIEALNLIFKN